MDSARFGGGVMQFVLVVAVLLLASELGGNKANAWHFEAGGRILLQVKNNKQLSTNLASTERIDPLDGFRKYRGGFNITSKHYWSSTIFTGVHGYSIGSLWLLFGTLYSAILLKTVACTAIRKTKNRKNHPCSTRRCHRWSKPVGLFFTLLVIVASAVVLAGSTRFHSRAGAVKVIVEESAHRASGTIYNVTGAMRSMQNVADLYGTLGGSTGRLASTARKLDGEASRIQKKAEKNARMIGRGLRMLEVSTVAGVSLNLAVVLLLLGSGFLKFKRPFLGLLIISWLLTSLCWAFFGLYFFIDRFSGDTCAALDEYRQDPRNSSLSAILPCNDQLSANLALRDTRAGIYDLVEQVNANISSLSSSSIPYVTRVCNPFSPPPNYNYQPQNCSSGETQIGEIPEILKRYTCSNLDGDACRAGEFISARDYNKVLIYTTSVQNLMNSFPGVESLVNCQLVRDAFSDILSGHCRPLRRHAHTSWAALAALSTAMVLLVSTWAMAARGDSRHHSSDVNPHLYRDTDSSDKEKRTEENQSEVQSEPSRGPHASGILRSDALWGSIYICEGHRSTGEEFF